MEREENPQHLVLLQELQLDGDVVSHPLVLLPVDLEHLLGLLNLGQGVGIAWSEIQLLQISAVSIVFNPVCDSNSSRERHKSVDLGLGGAGLSCSSFVFTAR